jgi:hypothetical protein
MKTIIKISILLFVVNLYSQKIKIKKEKLYIDKKEICKLIQIDRQHYSIKDLEDTPVFSLAYLLETGETLEGTKQRHYLKFKKPNSDEIYYSDYNLKGLKRSFSAQKMLVRHLIEKNTFLSKDGINYNTITAFFSQPQPRNNELEEKIARYKEALKTIEPYHLKFDGNTIYNAGGKKDILVGWYRTEAIPDYNAIRIKVYDAQGFLTATYQLGTIMFFDNKKIKFTAEDRSLIRAAEKVAKNAENVIKRMFIAGYVLSNR